MSKRVVLSPSERQRLGERVRSRKARAEEVLRAKIILLLASGESQWGVSRQLGCSINTVRLWLKRFLAERLAGLFSRHRGKIVDPESVQLEARILAAARHKPTDGSTHWSYSEVGGRTWHQPYASSPCQAGRSPRKRMVLAVLATCLMVAAVGCYRLAVASCQLGMGGNAFSTLATR